MVENVLSEQGVGAAMNFMNGVDDFEELVSHEVGFDDPVVVEQPNVIESADDDFGDFGDNLTADPLVEAETAVASQLPTTSDESNNTNDVDESSNIVEPACCTVVAPDKEIETVYMEGHDGDDDVPALTNQIEGMVVQDRAINSDLIGNIGEEASSIHCDEPVSDLPTQASSNDDDNLGHFEGTPEIQATEADPSGEIMIHYHPSAANEPENQVDAYLDASSKSNDSSIPEFEPARPTLQKKLSLREVGTSDTNVPALTTDASEEVIVHYQIGDEGYDSTIIETTPEVAVGEDEFDEFAEFGGFNNAFEDTQAKVPPNDDYEAMDGGKQQQDADADEVIAEIPGFDRPEIKAKEENHQHDIPVASKEDAISECQMEIMMILGLSMHLKTHKTNM